MGAIFPRAGVLSISTNGGFVGVGSTAGYRLLCYNNSMGKYEISAITTITAPPEKVWAVLDDFNGWPGWMPSMQNLRVELLSPGLPRPGYRFRLRGKLAYADLEVTTYESLERATHFRLNLPPLSGANRCRLTPLGDGRYRLERLDYLSLPGPVASFLDATQRSRFERLAAEFLHSLKRAVERSIEHASIGTTQ